MEKVEDEAPILPDAAITDKPLTSLVNSSYKVLYALDEKGLLL